MSVTATSMILRAQQLIGEKSLGATLTANEQTAYLSVLIAMLESWSNDRLSVPAITQESFPLVANTVSYTIGAAGVFATSRPQDIIQAFVRDANSYDVPVNIIQREAYDALRVKNVGTTYPSYLFYDNTNAAALGTIYVYPAPASGLTLFIDQQKLLQTFVTINDVLTLPPGYQRAIESNLAIELAAGQTPVSPELAKIAKDSLAAIRKNNLPVGYLRLDPGIARGAFSNILIGP